MRYCVQRFWFAGLITLAGVVILLSTSRAEPATAKIAGLGATSCTQFLHEVMIEPKVQRDYLAWAQGFMSGILLGRPAGVDEDLNLIPPTFPLLKQLEFLSEYCKKNPTEDFSDAVVSLYKRLRKTGTI